MIDRKETFCVNPKCGRWARLPFCAACFEKLPANLRARLCFSFDRTGPHVERAVAFLASFDERPGV